MGGCGPTPEDLPSVRRKVHGAVMAWARTAAICAAAVSAWLPTAVAAKADSSSDFLAMLSAKGLNVGDTPADVQLTLYEGDAICHLMYWGYTPQVAARQVPYAFPNAHTRAGDWICARGADDSLRQDVHHALANRRRLLSPSCELTVSEAISSLCGPQ